MTTAPAAPSYSADIIGGNDDIITEILTHLPIKSLMRFKSVSKQFNSLISSPSFSLLHTFRHPKPSPSALFLPLPLSSSPSFSLLPFYSPSPLPSPPSLHPCSLIQSCNGLLLFVISRGTGFSFLVVNPTTWFVFLVPVVLDPNSNFSIGQGPGEIVVSNSGTHIPIGQGHIVVSNTGHGQVVLSDPSTQVPILHGQGHGHWHERGDVVLSDPRTLFDDTQIGFEKAENEQVGLNLAFDPSRWAHYYLIRVFKHFLDGGDNRFSIAVYGSDNRVWRDRVVWFDNVNVPFDVEFWRGVYWKGRVFWLSHTGSTVYYDVDNEVVERLVLPKVFDEETYLERFRYFGECCGHLHLIEIRTNCVREFDVLELEENGEGFEWVVRFEVDLDVVGCGFEDDMFQDGVDRFGRRLRFYALSILAVIRDDGDGANDALVLSIPSKVISYSFKSRVSRLLCNVVDESDKWFPFRGYNAFQFIESLYRP